MSKKLAILGCGYLGSELARQALERGWAVAALTRNAATAVSKVLPDLTGKLTANAIRVPTPNVSLVILNLTLSQETTQEEVNTYLRDISLDSPLQGQIDYTTSPEVVSSDFIGTEKTGVVDAAATIVQGKRCVLYVWYDNEYGYSRQVIRLLQHISGLNLPSFPK